MDDVAVDDDEIDDDVADEHEDDEDDEDMEEDEYVLYTKERVQSHRLTKYQICRRGHPVTCDGRGELHLALFTRVLNI